MDRALSGVSSRGHDRVLHLIFTVGGLCIGVSLDPVWYHVHPAESWYHCTCLAPVVPFLMLVPVILVPHIRALVPKMIPVVSKFGTSLQEWHHWCQLFSRSLYVVYLSSLMPWASKLHCFRETIFQNRLVLQHRVLLVPLLVPTGFLS
jgi:hypothetical protein